jgi:ribosomal protein S18 acetylase RimI-like enzyme
METSEIEFSLPRGGTLALRPVSDADQDFLLSVYKSTRADELAQVPWGDEQKRQFLKWQFDLQRREYDARFSDADYSVILIDERPAGRIWIARDDQEIRLLDIAILPEFQNRGAGTLLLHWLIDESMRASKALRHMVFVLNQDAQRFYERLGFVVIEEVGAYKHMEWKSEPPAVAGGPNTQRSR